MQALHHLFQEPKNSSFSPWFPPGDISEIGQFLKQVTLSCVENNQKQKGRHTRKLKDSSMCPAQSQLFTEKRKQNMSATFICALFRLYLVVEITTRILACCKSLLYCVLSRPSHTWKERRMKAGGKKKNKRDSGYFFPFHEQFGA